MGNTEMTKYMAAGAFADLTSSRSKFDELGATGSQGLAKSGDVRRQDLRRAVLRRLARRHLPHRPLQEGRDQEAADEPRQVHRRLRKARRRRTRASRASRRSTSAGTDWYFAMSFVYDYGGSIATTHARQVGRHARLAEVDRRADRVQELLPRGRRRRAKTLDENQSRPRTTSTRRAAPASIVGPGWFSCCVGDEVQDGRRRSS